MQQLLIQNFVKIQLLIDLMQETIRELIQNKANKNNRIFNSI